MEVFFLCLKILDSVILNPPVRQVQVDGNSPMLGEHTIVLFYLVGAITSWKLALAIFMAKKKS
jgi:hypothetical protein